MMKKVHYTKDNRATTTPSIKAKGGVAGRVVKRHDSEARARLGRLLTELKVVAHSIKADPMGRRLVFRWIVKIERILLGRTCKVGAKLNDITFSQKELDKINVRLKDAITEILSNPQVSEETFAKPARNIGKTAVVKEGPVKKKKVATKKKKAARRKK